MASPIYYIDISKIGKDFTGKKDVLLLTNEQALLESVKNILSTEPGERAMNPNFGCELSKYLFEPLDVVTAVSIKYTIENAIRKFEPRIDTLIVNVDENQDDLTINIDIVFNMKTSSKTQTLTLDLKKIR